MFLWVACSSKNLRRAWAIQPISVTPRFDAGLVAAEIIADQLALAVLQEVTRMLAGPAEAEVVNDSRGFAKRADGVSPNVGTMGFLGARHEHLHRRSST